MNRRQLLLLALTVLVIVASIFGVLRFKGEPEARLPFQAVSNDAAAVLAINNYEEALHQFSRENELCRELMNCESLISLRERFSVLDSSIFTHIDRDFLSELKMLIAFYPYEGGHEQCYIVYSEHHKAEAYLDHFKSILSELKETELFMDVPVYEAYFEVDNTQPIYITENNGLCLISQSLERIHQSMETLVNAQGLESIPGFKRVKATTGEYANWNLFFNYQMPEGLEFMGLKRDESGDRKTWSTWTALDATVHQNLALLNGFSKSEEGSFLRMFDKQKPQDIDAVEIIPEDVMMFYHFGVSNYAKYQASRKQYFSSIGLGDAYSEKLDVLNREHHIDIESEFGQWVANEFGVMFVSAHGVEPKESKVVFFRLSDPKKAKAVLERMHYEGLESDPTLGETQLGIEKLFDGIEAEVFIGIDKPHFALVDKYLLFSEHSELIDKVKRDYEQGRTLAKSAVYSELAGNLSDQSNVYIYINTNKGWPVYSPSLTPRWSGFLNTNNHLLEKFEQLGIQFKDSKNDLFYQHVALNYKALKRKEGRKLWELALDTGLAMKPKIVYNHYTNAREIFVQDLSNKIYLIDNKGKVLWDRQLKEPIVSDVFQIDVYKNNKLQILFSGESSIYLIDRKGRDVENFPVQLPAVSTNGISVIDYEKNREYRILVAVRGGKILNYDRFGEKVKGWSFRADEEIESPIKYFLLNGKDYIVTVGSTGTPFILNRRGDPRVSIDEHLPSGIRDFNLDLSNDIYQCTFVSADEQGNVVKLHFNGEKEILNFDQFSPGHYFLYEDLNNDQKEDFIFQDSMRLLAFDHRREKIFEVELSSATQQPPAVFRFSDGFGQIGISDDRAKQIYLYREAGKIDRNFPVDGEGMFTISDIDKDGRFNIITALGSTLIVYNME